MGQARLVTEEIGADFPQSGILQIQRRAVHSNHLQNTLGCDPYDRQSKRRFLRL